MTTQLLNGVWDLLDERQEKICEGTVPGSLYSFLLNEDKMEDPYFRDNEKDALKLCAHDYYFRKEFKAGRKIPGMAHQVIRFDGIDTLAVIWLNGILIGTSDNMHRTFEFDVSGLLKEENTLLVKIESPTKYISKEDKRDHIGGSTDAMLGFPHIRKAHCMFGWDWGPRLPDMGIWRGVSLLGWNSGRIRDFAVHQLHIREERPKEEGPGDDKKALLKTPKGHGRESDARGDIRVELTIDVDIEGDGIPEITLTAPSGEVSEIDPGDPHIVIFNPQLWWPNGLGGQPLYTVSVSLQDKDIRSKSRSSTAQTLTKRIGLRTMKVQRKEDAWGESFAFEVNGQTFFAMGADYIPEDNILSRTSKRRTKRLLCFCRDCHFNMVRVWGGGYYPEDYFYDLCDEYGLVVWQDLMFACANYEMEDRQFGGETFAENISEEIRQNVRRIRHHACLGLWCGNNEMEQFAKTRTFDGTDKTARDYLIQNEWLVPGILKKEDPDTFYWPSSPSSGGCFDNPSDEHRGDVHYWDVWHGGVPFTAYRKYYFRFLSEFGFQSFPVMKTIEAFTEPEDRNIFSKVMELHQRNTGANGKILQYLSLTYRYPKDFPSVVYASELLQADAVRYGVEHLRRNRNGNRCMGAIYWQLDDIWPGASWSSVDYYGNWKALQYYAKRFFAPVLISCEETSIVSEGRTVITDPSLAPIVPAARLCVTNETWNAVSGKVIWEVRDPKGRIVTRDKEQMIEGREEAGRAESDGKKAGRRELRGEASVTVAPFSSLWLDTIDLEGIDIYREHLVYRFIPDEKTLHAAGEQQDRRKEQHPEESAAKERDIGKKEGAAEYSTEYTEGLSGTVLFCPPKHYAFENPHLAAEVLPDKKSIRITADAFAKSVMIDDKSFGFVLEDNFFDMEPGVRTIRVLEGKVHPRRVRAISVIDIG